MNTFTRTTRTALALLKAQQLLMEVSTDLHVSLSMGSIVTHAPMNEDMKPGKGYYNVIAQIKDNLNFIMPQYYNGVVHPVSGGFGRMGEGSISVLKLMGALVDLFDGDAAAIVLGFCITGCAGSASGQEASFMMNEMQDSFPCHSGTFFCVAESDSLWL